MGVTDTKHCTKCARDKPLDDFHNDKRRRGGKNIYCKECHSAYMRNRYANQPGVREKHLAHHKEQRRSDPVYRAKHKKYAGDHYSSLMGRAQTLLKGARRRQSDSTVTLEHILSFLQIGMCPMTGIKFSLTSDYRARSGRQYNAYAPSLDKIDPKGGYTNENTRVVIWQYNLMKHEASDGETYIIAKAFVERFERAVR